MNRRLPTRTRALVAGLLASVALCAAPAAAHADPFVGVQAWGATPSQAEFDQMARAGIGVFREEFLWESVEPRRGDRSWHHFDTLMGRAARAGVDILPAVQRVPDWAEVRSGSPFRVASTRRAWSRFVRDLVARYKPNGAFWRANPRLPARPIRAWQIWNEPNLNSWWFRRPRASEYATLLRVSAGAIRRADRRARIVLAGLPESRFGIRREPYLRALYRVRGVRRWFDVMGVHGYALDAAGVDLTIRSTRAFMRSRGDGRTPMWITELGWATGGPPGFFVTTHEGQAERLRASYQVARARSRSHRVGRVIWFTYKDRALGQGERDWWAPHTGLLERDGRPKPSWRAMAEVAGGQP